RHAAHQSAAPTDGADFSMYKALYDRHSAYKEPSITRQRFKHAAIAPLVQRLQSPFQWSVDGKSIEGRNIYRVQYGNGPIKVLLWSQMHGDEPTATMALMDIFNFLSRSDEWDELRSRLRSELTLVFVPMLNPDGAERFERRNALGIDLNRDALRLQCPESQLLKRLRDELSAQWGFNLHDQGRFYGAGLGPKNAAMAFLAPAYNYEKEINDSRGNAMQLIAGLSAFLHEYIPGHIARYDDEFEPRAFGDNIQKWGTSTILIEAGVLPNDPEKQELRRL
ncbi:MAG TPA: M14 family zinc carboxypeptidase, partial [Saprospiraceae bacterium]|nr:M14 family zinc carboxypeptidase [Saprospiraceae bacterium]